MLANGQIYFIWRNGTILKMILHEDRSILDTHAVYTMVEGGGVFRVKPE